VALHCFNTADNSRQSLEETDMNRYQTTRYDDQRDPSYRRRRGERSERNESGGERNYAGYQSDRFDREGAPSAGFSQYDRDDNFVDRARRSGGYDYGAQRQERRSHQVNEDSVEGRDRRDRDYGRYARQDKRRGHRPFGPERYQDDDGYASRAYDSDERYADEGGAYGRAERGAYQDFGERSSDDRFRRDDDKRPYGGNRSYSRQGERNRHEEYGSSRGHREDDRRFQSDHDSNYANYGSRWPRSEDDRRSMEENRDFEDDANWRRGTRR